MTENSPNPCTYVCIHTCWRVVDVLYKHPSQFSRPRNQLLNSCLDTKHDCCGSIRIMAAIQWFQYASKWNDARIVGENYHMKLGMNKRIGPNRWLREGSDWVATRLLIPSACFPALTSLPRQLSSAFPDLWPVVGIAVHRRRWVELMGSVI